MLFEAQIASPHPSSYYQHQYLVGLFLHLDQERMRQARIERGESPVRDYLWCESDGILHVRRTVPTDNILWQPVTIPPANSMINFQLQARCRKQVGDLWRQGHPEFSRGARPSIIDPNEAMEWLEITGEKSGLCIEDAEVEVVLRTIEKPTLARRHGVCMDFDLWVSQFYGVATVRDPVRFERSLMTGVGDSKAFGFGFILFWQRGQHAT